MKEAGGRKQEAGKCKAGSLTQQPDFEFFLLPASCALDKAVRYEL